MSVSSVPELGASVASLHELLTQARVPAAMLKSRRFEPESRSTADQKGRDDPPTRRHGRGLSLRPFA